MANGSNNIAVTLYYVDTRDRDSDRVKDSCKYIMQPSINVLCVCNAYPAPVASQTTFDWITKFWPANFCDKSNLNLDTQERNY